MCFCGHRQVRRLDYAKKNCGGMKTKTNADRAKARQHDKQRKADAVAKGIAALTNRKDKAEKNSAVVQYSSVNAMQSDYDKLTTIGTRKDFCLRQHRSYEQTHAEHLRGNVNLGELLARSCAHSDFGERCPNDRCGFVLKAKTKEKPPSALVVCLAELIPMMSSMAGRTPDECIAAAKAKKVTAARSSHSWAGYGGISRHADVGEVKEIHGKKKEASLIRGQKATAGVFDKLAKEMGVALSAMPALPQVRAPTKTAPTHPAWSTGMRVEAADEYSTQLAADGTQQKFFPGKVVAVTAASIKIKFDNWGSAYNKEYRPESKLVRLPQPKPAPQPVEVDGYRYINIEPRLGLCAECAEAWVLCRRCSEADQ